MIYYMLLLLLVNGIIGGVINEEAFISPNYGNCEEWIPLIKSTGFDIDKNCCDTKGIECQDSKVVSIDITIDSGVIDMSKLPSLINLDKYSIKGDIYQGVFPIELLNTSIFKILDLSNSNIKEIPENIDENNTIEEIYLSNNQIQKFPYQFEKISNLKVLKLNDNNITGSYTNSCGSFQNLEILSLKNNDITGIQYFDENVNDFCESVNIELSIVGTLNFEDEDDDDSIAEGLFIICVMVGIPIVLMLFGILNDRTGNSEAQAYLDFRNQCISYRNNTYEVLPDYNDIVKDPELPTYEEAVDNSVMDNSVMEDNNVMDNSVTESN